MWGFTECRAVSGLLWNYAAHRLREGELDCVERHLAGCDACRTEVDTIRLTVDGLQAARSHPIPESRRGWREVQARLSTPEPRPMVGAGWRMSPAAWASAFVATAAVCLTLIGHPRDTANARSSENTSPSNSVASRQPRDSQRNVADAGDDDSTIGDASFDSQFDFGSAPAAPTELIRRPVRHHVSRRAIRTASSRSFTSRGQVVAAGRPAPRRSALDLSRVDGRDDSSSGDTGYYVLTPVSASSESDGGEQYVMGGVVVSSRSSDSEVARGW